LGDWGLGIGDWGLGIGPNPQSPIPNPQSPISILSNNNYNIYNKKANLNIIIILNKTLLKLYIILLL